MTATSIRRILEINAFLQDLYDGLDKLSGTHGPFPVAVLPVSQAAAQEPDRLSIKLQAAPQSAIAIEATLNAEEQRKRGQMWDGVTYALSGLELDASGAVDGFSGYLGSYFKMLDTAGYLEKEVQATGDGQLALEKLPARRRILEAFSSPRDCLSRGGALTRLSACPRLSFLPAAELGP